MKTRIKRGKDYLKKLKKWGHASAKAEGCRSK
jgi:hypothetical protein